jgi:hypothetical protein
VKPLSENAFPFPDASLSPKPILQIRSRGPSNIPFKDIEILKKELGVIFVFDAADRI